MMQPMDRRRGGDFQGSPLIQNAKMIFQDFGGLKPVTPYIN
jgi:hypothetical protein